MAVSRQSVTFRPLQGSGALLYAARCEPCFALFLGSSAVEHSTVNRMVAGSNPARGAKQIKYFAQNPNLDGKPRVGKSVAAPGVKTRGFAGRFRSVSPCTEKPNLMALGALRTHIGVVPTFPLPAHPGLGPGTGRVPGPFFWA
jgi:hypothetical protein